ncbi:10012_t:CDS:2 [Funneliformis geosporum]|uniref:10012_t:CDS:1 n=1 Tax=Funneliformis geosporum TaxID=1117311 RepID=A0A9W4SZF0_9GLOM|nr:10012_t:CDS:2 [Funneliformis geosporum]
MGMINIDRHVDLGPAALKYGWTNNLTLGLTEFSAAILIRDPEECWDPILYGLIIGHRICH